ncbi:MAG: hypothetical protein QGH83_01910 [Candidatus Pacebacteria bacterium]|jgi:hypothetical protein|nr:hypothetical protein [Candidatus Paceibacterota bacterium]|tara:strand:- start:729 stop:938 length:210 start_codon:yes stop_codon:yes gene_type:complete
MSVWDDEWEDNELDKHDFEMWLDSINESGDPDRDEEFYNKEMARQKMMQVEYPEVVVQTSKYTMTYSNN